MPVRLLGVPWDATTLGRKGARLAPESIRRELAHLHPFDARGERPVSWLAGKDLSLTEEHADLVRTVGRAVDQEVHRDPDSPVVLLGGDHAITFAGVSALHRHFPSLQVVSLDAHLDLRERAGGPSNGNWALRVREDLEVPICVVGTGRFANDGALYERARSLGVRWVSAERTRDVGPERALAEAGIGDGAPRDLYVTLDIDVIDQSFSPGASSPSPDGLSPAIVEALLRVVALRGRVRGFDLTEVNPAVDPAGLTPRLAAHLLLAFLSLRSADGPNP